MECTRETVLDVTLRLFGNEEFAQAWAILQSVDAQWSNPTTLLCILRGSNGNLDRLQQYKQTAQEDFRDVYLVGCARRGFRLDMTTQGQVSQEAEQHAEEEDAAEFEAWVVGRERRLLCERCGGFGIIPYRAEDGGYLPDWKECEACRGSMFQSVDLPST